MNEAIDKAIREKHLYLVGDKLPANFYEAIPLWLPLAEAGDAKAQYNIGRCYHNGDGVDKDYGKAMEWYQKAVQNNDPRAHHNLSLMYSEGQGCDRDDAKARELMSKAAELGDAHAICKKADEESFQRDVDAAQTFQGFSREDLAARKWA